MQTFKDKQQQLFRWDHLPQQTHDWLEVNWPGAWQRSIIPLIDESMFRDLYCKNDGAPSKATADMVGILILKECYDLTFQEAIEHVMLDVGWQYALDLLPEQAYVSLRTLKYFSAKVMKDETHRPLFEDLTKKIIDLLGVSFDHQVLDSTHILSNIAHLSRLGLFVRTIENFLSELKKSQPKRYAKLDHALTVRYTEREGFGFGDARGSDARRRLGQCAEDLFFLVQRFAKAGTVRKMKSYQTLNRLFIEQCHVADGEGASASEPVRVILKEPKEISGDTLQSPYDEEAGYSGHKGKGYQAQIAQTSDPEAETQIITYVEVESASASDADALVIAVDMMDAGGVKPKTVTADTAYCGAENDIALRDRGVALIGPTPGPEPQDTGTIPIGAFDPAPNLKTVIRCPAGERPMTCVWDESTDTVIAVFFSGRCEACAWRALCPVKKHRDGHTLRYSRCQMATSLRRMNEKTEAYKESYKKRARIESTNSELKRPHGLGRLRVRGQPAVEMVVFMKIIACNIKRYLRALMERERIRLKDENQVIQSQRTPENAGIGVMGRVFLFSATSTASAPRMAA